MQCAEMPSSRPFSEVSLDAKVAFLRKPSSYPEPSQALDTIETHMSWVFLTDSRAYKLKKPVCHDAFDFRALNARRFYCEEELRLNRRLAPDVYLDVVPMSQGADGELGLNADGQAVDYLVRMRRLPAEMMLDQVLRSGSASAHDVLRVALRLAAFYRDCPAVRMEPLAYRAAFGSAIARNLAELSRPAYRLPKDRIARLCAAQDAVLAGASAWFDKRVQQGHVVEGHGDLRPEHVCLEANISVIDCLEFSRDLRLLDPVDEVGFLALECERLGADLLAGQLLHSFREACGDWPQESLVHFYQSYRASVRARLAIRHLDEERFRTSDKWRQRASEYLGLAERHQASISSLIDPPL
jgi:uncharacterized protein